MSDILNDTEKMIADAWSGKEKTLDQEYWDVVADEFRLEYGEDWKRHVNPEFTYTAGLLIGRLMEKKKSAKLPLGNIACISRLIDGAEDIPTKFEIFDDSCMNAFKDSFRAGYLLAQMEEGDWKDNTPIPAPWGKALEEYEETKEQAFEDLQKVPEDLEAVLESLEISLEDFRKSKLRGFISEIAWQLWVNGYLTAMQEGRGEVFPPQTMEEAEA